MIKKIAQLTWKSFFNIKKRGMQPPLPVEKIDLSGVKRILAVSSTAIGDTLFATPALSALKEQFPHVETDLVAREKFIPLFNRIPGINRIIPYSGAFKNCFRLFKELKSGKYDLCIVFHDSDPCPVQAAWLAGIPFILRIGQRDDYVADLLSCRIPWHGTEHAIEHRLALVELITGRSFKKKDDVRMKLHVKEQESLEYMDRIFKLHGLAESRRYIKTGFQLQASGEYKTWPSENFVNLAKLLTEFAPDVTIITMGSPSEQGAVQKAVEEMKKAGVPEQRIINMAGRAELADLPLLVNGLDLLVTNDTGPLHVAIATNTPTVSLFVPTHANRTGPIQDLHMHTVVKKPAPCPECVEKYCQNPYCMSLVTVTEVFEAVRANPGFRKTD